MSSQLIKEVGSHRHHELLAALKRRGGMSVKELSSLFGMSYMGIKGICLRLERDGLLDTFRRPVALGRPELVYRLSRRAHDLFPGASHHLTAEILDAVQQTYGPAAPTKLLFVVFAQRAEVYRAQITGETLAERAASLAKIRDAEGYMAEFHPPGDPADANGDRPGPPGACRIVEHQSPIAELARRWPIVERLERELFERTLGGGCTVRREGHAGAAGHRCTFHLASPASSR